LFVCVFFIVSLTPFANKQKRHKMDPNLLLDFFLFAPDHGTTHRDAVLSFECLERIVWQLSASTGAATGATGHAQDFLTLWLNSISSYDSTAKHFDRPDASGRYLCDSGGDCVFQRILGLPCDRAGSGAAAVPSKLNMVLQRLREFFERLADGSYVPRSPAPDPFILPYITTLVRQTPPLVADALRYVQGLRSAKQTATSVPDFVGSDNFADLDAEENTRSSGKTNADKAIELLCWVVDADHVFDEALGLYDFELCSAVAQHTNKDPREFLPRLEGWKALLDRTSNPDFVHGHIDTHLRRFDKALRNFHRGGQSLETRRKLNSDAGADVASDLVEALHASLDSAPDSFDGHLQTAYSSWKMGLELCFDHPELSEDAVQLWSEHFQKKARRKDRRLQDPLVRALVTRHADILLQSGRPLESGLLQLQCHNLDGAIHSFTQCLRQNAQGANQSVILQREGWRYCMAAASISLENTFTDEKVAAKVEASDEEEDDYEAFSLDFDAPAVPAASKTQSISSVAEGLVEALTEGLLLFAAVVVVDSVLFFGQPSPSF
jgi:IKI3 family